MRFLKLAIISIVVLFLLITLISVFIPSTVRITRNTSINASDSSIIDDLDDIRKWATWYPGFDTIQPSALLEENGKLHSAKVPGDITIILTEINEKGVIAEFRSQQRKPIISGWRLIRHPGADSTFVQWHMDFKLRWYPWEKFSGFMLEGLYGPRMVEGLRRLKLAAENKAER